MYGLCARYSRVLRNVFKPWISTLMHGDVTFILKKTARERSNPFLHIQIFKFIQSICANVVPTASGHHCLIPL